MLNISKKSGTLVALLFFFLAGVSFADSSHVESQYNSSIAASLGYRGLSAHGTPNRAREYDSLESSPTLDLSFTGELKETDLSATFNYLNDKDYHFEGDVNHRSLLRLKLRNERFFHNLDHIPYDQATEEDARPDAEYTGTKVLQLSPPPVDPPLGTVETFLSADYEDRNPDTAYGIRLEFYEAAMRGKLPNYPAHLNLKYWRREKEGRKQLRYVDENCAAACHMRSRDRSVDQVTEEFSASIDAHVGFIDLVFEQVFRKFDNENDTPTDLFDGHFLRSKFAFFPTQDPQPYEHDENPDSNFKQSTIKANTTLGGGFVANASFSIGERENESDQSDVAPIKSDVDFYKFASDVTYTPSENWTWNFRYRMLDLEHSNSEVIGGAGYQEFLSGNPGNNYEGESRSFAVRNNLDLDRDLYQASITFRPTHKISLKGSVHREDIDRSDTNGAVDFDGIGAGNNNQTVIDPYWELPDDESIIKARLSYSSRHLKKNALKLKAWWEYQHSDDPAYATSTEDGNTVFLSATYRPGILWGTTASLHLKESRNNNHQSSQFVDSTAVYYDQDRDQEQQNANVGLWYNPLPGLNIDLNYGYLRTRILQDLLFGNEAPDYTIQDNDVEYRQSVHTLSAGASWQILESLRCRLEGYHIRSEATYSPSFPTDQYIASSGADGFLVNGSSSDLRDISKVDIRQNGLRGRINWQLDENWSTGVEATLDDYDDLGRDAFDGSVQTYMANISRAW